MSDDEFRMVSLSREQRDRLWGVRPEIAQAWDKAPASAWDEIADEFRRHRCKDGNCFAESVLTRLGAIPCGNPNSPYGF